MTKGEPTPVVVKEVGKDVVVIEQPAVRVPVVVREKILVPKAAYGFWRCVPEGQTLVLLDPDRGVYYGLNEVGTRIWTLLAAGSSREQIEGQLVAEYDALLENVRADLQNLLAELLEHGLIEEIEG